MQRKTAFKSLFPDAEPIPHDELTTYLRKNPLDHTKTAYQISHELERIFNLRCTLTGLVMAAIFSGHAAVPSGRAFRFVIMNATNAN